MAPTPQAQQYQSANSGTRWANSGSGQAVVPTNRNPPPRVNSATAATPGSGGILRKVSSFFFQSIITLSLGAFNSIK